MKEDIEDARAKATRLLQKAQSATELLSRLRQEGIAHSLLRQAAEIERLQSLREALLKTNNMAVQNVATPLAGEM